MKSTGTANNVGGLPKLRHQAVTRLFKNAASYLTTSSASTWRRYSARKVSPTTSRGAYATIDGGNRKNGYHKLASIYADLPSRIIECYSLLEQRRQQRLQQQLSDPLQLRRSNMPPPRKAYFLCGPPSFV